MAAAKYCYEVHIEDEKLGKSRLIECHIVENSNVGNDDVIVVSFDIETIGQYMDKNAMVELGAVAFVGDGQEMRVIGTFEGHLAIPEGCGFEGRCEKEFWDVHKAGEKQLVQDCTIPPEITMLAFRSWVHELHKRCIPNETRPERRIRFASDAVYFDAAWVSYYLSKFADHPVLHQFFSTEEKGSFMPVLDTNSYNRGIAKATLEQELKAMRGPTGWFSSDSAMLDALGLATCKPPVSHDHRAVNDAHAIGWKYFRAIRKIKELNAWYDSAQEMGFD